MLRAPQYRIWSLRPQWPQRRSPTSRPCPARMRPWIHPPASLRIAPRYSLVLSIGGLVYVTFMMIAHKDTAVYGPTQGAPALLQVAINQYGLDRTPAPYIRACI